MPLRILTIGVYGFDEEAFFRTLQEAGVDVLCDVRQRRGVRGSAYAFANSRRLQARLAELGIRYVHRKDLAPTKAMRNQQALADKEAKIAKRKRSTLDPTFVQAYRGEILAELDANEFVESLPPDARVVALLCVERDPAACHRSLLAERLARDLNAPVEHLIPPRK